jgi:hypothetical protein
MAPPVRCTRGMSAGSEPLPGKWKTRCPRSALVLDVGAAGLGDPQPLHAQQHGQGEVGVLAALGREQEPGQLAAVKAPPLGLWHRGAAHVLGRVRRIRPSMWAIRKKPQPRGHHSSPA